MYYVLFRDNRNEWRWRFRADDHQDICASSQGYPSKHDARLSINLVKSGAATAKIFDAEEKTWSGK